MPGIDKTFLLAWKRLLLLMVGPINHYIGHSTSASYSVYDTFIHYTIYNTCICIRRPSKTRVQHTSPLYLGSCYKRRTDRRWQILWFTICSSLRRNNNLKEKERCLGTVLTKLYIYTLVSYIKAWSVTFFGK